MDDHYGNRYGNITVTGQATYDSADEYTRKIEYEITCDCGTKKTVTARSLDLNAYQDCGCVAGLSRRKDLIGKVFHEKTVLGVKPGDNNNPKMFLVRCLNCTNTFECTARQLKFDDFSHHVCVAPTEKNELVEKTKLLLMEVEKYPLETVPLFIIDHLDLLLTEMKRQASLASR